MLIIESAYKLPVAVNTGIMKKGWGAGSLVFS